MKKLGFLQALFGDERQRKRQKFLIREFSMILGAIFLSQGIISLVPPSSDKASFFTLGFVLILTALLSKTK